MLKNENILCVSYTMWEGPYTKSVVQLMSLLARENKVLFAEYPFTVKDVIWGLMGKNDAPVMRILGWKKRLETKQTNFGSEVYNWVAPPVFPTNFIKNERAFRFLNELNVWIFRKSVQRVLRKLNMPNVINVNAYNCYFGIPLIGRLNEKANIYYCYDGMVTDRHGNRALVMDEEFSRKVDSVIVTSDFLKNEKLAWNNRVDTVKNGVDFQVFCAQAKKIPHQNRKRKKVGYIGSVDQRFDLEKVEYAIRHLPEVDFEFVGDVRNAIVKSILSMYPNVKFLPPVAPNDVPKLLSDCDAGIIPYIADDINKNVYPLKLNEYLAVGVPVVLTRFAKLTEFEEIASFASTDEEFLSSIKKEIEHDSIERIAARIEFAKENSWENRAKLFGDAIERTINAYFLAFC
ncbi:MAG: glycosyltransferase [Bacteroidales bacterium]|nr:glycosyltransferase [Bacteroidales bacterium]